MTNDDRWNADGAANGWTVDHLKAAWPWRLPGVRLLRFVWHAWRAGRMARAFGSVGIGTGAVQSYDVWVLYAIRRGWA